MDNKKHSIILIELIIYLTIPIITLAQNDIEKASKLYENQKGDEAAKILKGIEKRANDYATAQFYLGRIAFDQKKYEEASEYFEVAIDFDKQNADYFNWLGNSYRALAQDAGVFRQSFLAPKMRDAWEKAITLDSKNILARKSLVEYYLEAPSFMGGSVKKAKEIAGHIALLNHAQGHLTMGDIYVREKDVVAAEKEYIAMVKEDESLNIVLSNFYLSQKQYVKAMDMSEAFIKINPTAMKYFYQIGKASALSGIKIDRGEECLLKYLNYKPMQSEPSHAGANMRLAQIHERRGNRASAKKFFELALLQDNSLKEAKEGLDRMTK